MEMSVKVSHAWNDMFLYLTISSASVALPFLFYNYFIVISWTSRCNTSCTYFLKRELPVFITFLAKELAILFPVLYLKIKAWLKRRIYFDLSVYVTENTNSLHYKDQSHTCANVFLWNMYYVCLILEKNVNFWHFY